MITKKRLLWTFVALGAAVGLWILVGGLVAQWKDRALNRRWGETLSPLESLLDRFPEVEVNNTALTLEALATSLGIDLAPLEARDRSHPSPASRKGLGDVSLELTRFLKSELERPDAEVDPLPEKLGQFLAQHERDLSAIRTHVLQSDPRRCETDISRAILAPFPNFNGQKSLHRLFIADALEKSRLGHSAEALADLEVCWKINSSIRERPEPISQIWAGVFATLQAGALRKTQGVPAAWQNRLAEHDYRKSYLAAQQVEASVFPESAREGSFWLEKGPLRFFPAPLVRPYLRFAAADYAEQLRQAVAEFQKQDVCSPDPVGLHAKFDSPLPKWNILSYYLTPSAERYWRRVCRLLIDLELTQRILQVRQLQSESRLGTWPREIPGIESSVYSGAQCVYQVTPEGTMSLAFSRKLEWPGSAADFSLPLTDTEQARQGRARSRL